MEGRWGWWRPRREGNQKITNNQEQMRIIGIVQGAGIEHWHSLRGTGIEVGNSKATGGEKAAIDNDHEGCPYSS